MTVTGPGAPGKVSATFATPELSVTAITLGPENIFSPFPDATLVSDPALVLKKTLAPALLPPDDPGASVTLSATGKVVPALPVWLSPAVLDNVAVGFPTTIHPLSVSETPPLSVAGTENE